MNEIRDLIIGIDFGEQTSQIAYYDRKSGEPVSVAERVGSSDMEIPTMLCRRMDAHGGYCVGKEARYFARERDGILIHDLYTICEGESAITVGEEQMEPYRLAAEYFLGLLKLLGAADVVYKTRCLVITVRELGSVLVRNLSRACEEMGFLREEYMLMDYPQSFYYYAMTQRRENWNRNIGWYQVDETQVCFHRLSVKATANPVLVRLETGGEKTLPQEKIQRDVQLRSFIIQTLGEDLYSTIFITGSGFSAEWADGSIKILCQQQRKVFYGNNLFANGACAAGKERKENNHLRNYRFLSDSMVLTNVGMDMKVMGAPSYVPLIEAGKNWYEYHPACELILDKVNELVFAVSQAGETERRRIAMELAGLPKRPDKTTRLRIEMEYISREECVVTVRDLGFGEMFPSSGKVWKESIRWQQDAYVGDSPAAETGRTSIEAAFKKEDA